MLPDTLHGVGVITKLHFAIFVAFEESMTLNLAQRSFKVIDFCTNRKRMYIFLLVVNSNLDPILHRFRDTAAKCPKSTIFPIPSQSHIPAKIWGVPFVVDPSRWGAQRVKGFVYSAVKLFSMNSNLLYMTTIPQRYRRTDRRTDRQLALAIPRSA